MVLDSLPTAPSEAEAPESSIRRMLQAVCLAMPEGVNAAVAWRDWAAGSGSCAMPDGLPALRRRAEQALVVESAERGDDVRVESWDCGGGARMALAMQFPPLIAPERAAALQSAARALLDAGLDAVRAHARIASLEKSKRLQQALYEIADLSGAELEMEEMLRRLHAVVASLMYAPNCFIALFDPVRETVRFLYFADEMDGWTADPAVEFTDAHMPNSLTFALLRHGKPLHGPSAELRRRFGVPRDTSHGPDSLDWLGVPMLRDGGVAGVVVVQSYDRTNVYDEGDRALLVYVAQHILTALDRRHAQEELERRVRERTRELRHANRDLQEEIAERKRAEDLQRALYRIAELANSSESVGQFYAEVHAVVAGLINARNFYIALLADHGRELDFVYAADENFVFPHSRPIGKGLTEYVLAQQRPMLLDRAAIDALTEQGEIVEIGVPAECWLGVPLYHEQEVVGVIAVQSYRPEVSFTAHDQKLLAFVAHNIGVGLVRQRSQEQRKHAHAELERRVDERTRELAEANRRLVAQIGERLRAEQRLTHQATHDALTGLPNRTHLLERLSAAVELARAGNGPAFAVLFLDLDRFKLVNDSIGHAAGDELLVEVARRITGTVRAEDVVARLGGDEFAILAAYRNDGGIDELTERLLVALGQPLWLAGRELFPSASVGVAIWHPRYRSGEELLRDADAAMYRAKAQGRNRSTLFDEAMREAAMQSLDLEADLRRAILSGDFTPYYQPIIRLEDGEVIGHEALLRWQHDKRGLLMPADFIGLGEETGLIEQVDWLIYAQVVEQIARGGSGYISVNVSPRHFHSSDFADRLLGMFDAVGADPSRLRVEITEIALLEDAPRTLRTLHLLRQHGILAQLDDFGTGFSALSYLHRFPISTLKIDRSFISGLGDQGSAESEAVVRAILALAGTLGIDTICEGVERADQLRALREMGARYGQGYLFGEPQVHIGGGV
ncbi:putative bifunctional diguanylate cyclase/phosphodiesterase [Pseudoxanthomonas helianthi]